MSNGISKENYPAFKKAYQKALKEGKDQFVFEGQDVLTAYAKYVCEYMDTQVMGR